MSARTPLSTLPKRQSSAKKRSHPNDDESSLQSPAKKRFKKALSAEHKDEEEDDLNVHFLDKFEFSTITITRVKDKERFELDDDDDAFCAKEKTKNGKTFKFKICISPTADPNGTYLNMSKMFKILKYSSKIQKRFLCSLKTTLKRTSNADSTSHFAKYKGAIWVTEKGWSSFIKWLSEYDGLSTFAQHFVSFRYYYRSKIFGSKYTKGMRKKQSLNAEIIICSVCHLEDIASNFDHSNACDCQCIVHKTCHKVKYIPTDDESPFCSICTSQYSMETLQKRKKLYAESGDFEVERVLDYDEECSEYFVKWLYFPHSANSYSALSVSFIDAVNEYWQNEEKIPKKAQSDINALMNKSTPTKVAEQMDKVCIDKKCEQQPDIAQKYSALKPEILNESESDCSDDEDDDNDVDVEMKSEEIKEMNQDIGKGKFIPVKLSEVMPKEFIIRRQKYTESVVVRYRATVEKYRKSLVKEIHKDSAIGRDLKRMMNGSNVLPRYHLRCIKQDFDCSLPRIRDIILNYLKTDWKQWSHEDISCRDQVVLAQIIDPENPALKHGGDQGVHSKKAFGLFAIANIKKDTLLFEYAGCVKPIGQASKKLDHLEHELSQTTLFDLIGHLDEKDRNKLFWGKAPNDQLVIDPSKYHNEGVYMNDYRDNVLDDPDDDIEGDENEQKDASIPNANGRRQNVKFYEILVNNWPRVFAVAMCDIEPGEELLGDYGPGFWKHFRCMMKRQVQLTEIKERVRKEVNDEWQIKYDELKREFDEYKKKMNDKKSNDSNN